MSGTTTVSRMIGCAYLYPYIVPDPYTDTVTLRQDDEFMIIASRGLWHYVGYDEAVQEVYETGNPVVAAKRLQDLAQGYGSKENLSILVIRFNTDSRPSLFKLRPKRHSMSIDDVEAAALHAALKQQKENGNNNNLPYFLPPPVLTHPPKIDEMPKIEPISQPEFNMSDTSLTRSLSSKEQIHEETKDVDTTEQLTSESSLSSMSSHRSVPMSIDSSDRPTASSSSLGSSIGHFGDGPALQSSGYTLCESGDDEREDSTARASVNTLTEARRPSVELKPLPNHRYIKKDTASEWEDILQRRLTEDVKTKELQQLIDSSRESLLPSKNLAITEIDADIGTSQTPSFITSRPSQMINIPSQDTVDSSFTFKTKFDKNQADSLLNLRKKEPKRVANTIAMFENMNQTHKHFTFRSAPNSSLTNYRPVSQFPDRSTRSYDTSPSRRSAPNSNSTKCSPTIPDNYRYDDRDLPTSDDTLCGSEQTSNSTVTSQDGGPNTTINTGQEVLTNYPLQPVIIEISQL